MVLLEVGDRAEEAQRSTWAGGGSLPASVGGGGYSLRDTTLKLGEQGGPISTSPCPNLNANREKKILSCGKLTS